MDDFGSPLLISTIYRPRSSNLCAGVHLIAAIPAEVQPTAPHAVQISLQTGFGPGQLRHPRELAHHGAYQSPLRAVPRGRGPPEVLAGEGARSPKARTSLEDRELQTTLVLFVTVHL